jgi:hypothetical protein
LSFGLLVGSTSDFDRDGFYDRRGTARHVSVGVPVRWEVSRTRVFSLAALGSVEWSYAPAATDAGGLMQFTVGPELASVWRRWDLRLAPLIGVISRRGADVDGGDHLQHGLETGTGLQTGPWRIGYSYRLAWVHDVRTLQPATNCGLCRALELTPPSTETYDRHALVLTRQF